MSKEKRAKSRKPAPKKAKPAKARSAPRAAPEVEARDLLAAIEENDGNLRRTAKALDVHPVTVHNRVKRLGLREAVQEIAEQQGWGRRGRQPQPRVGVMDPKTVIPLVRDLGVTEAARVTRLSPRTLHRICLEQGHDYRGRKPVYASRA